MHVHTTDILSCLRSFLDFTHAPQDLELWLGGPSVSLLAETFTGLTALAPAPSRLAAGCLSFTLNPVISFMLVGVGVGRNTECFLYMSLQEV